MIVAGGAGRELSRDDVLELTASAERTVLDVGTGDGRFAYRLAKDNPAWYVFALDAVGENLEEIARRAGRKPSRGGLSNVSFVVGRAEALPEDLDGVCDLLTVILPWGRLMRDVMTPDAETLAGFRRVARGGATLELVLNTEIFAEPVPQEVRDLPPVTPAYVDRVLRPAYRSSGIDLADARYLDEREVTGLHSTWSRKLAHGRSPRFVFVEGVFA